MRSINYVTDTGAEANLMTQEILIGEWIFSLKLNRWPQFWSVTNYKLTIVGSILLQLKIKRHELWLSSGLSNKMATQMLVGT